jgi:hypothetical protein
MPDGGRSEDNRSEANSAGRLRRAPQRRDSRAHLRKRSTGRELWRWTQSGCGGSHGPNGGVTDSLDEAKAAFRATWDAHG